MGSPCNHFGSSMTIAIARLPQNDNYKHEERETEKIFEDSR